MTSPDTLAPVSPHRARSAAALGHEPTHALVPRRQHTPPGNAVALPFEPPPPDRDDRSIDARFAAYHDAHPEVYRELVRLTRELVDAGETRVGIGMLFEVLRWDRLRRRRAEGEPFALNNVYRSRYARLIMSTEVGLDGVFELRALPSRRAS